MGQARPVATSWTFAGTLPFIGTKIQKRLAHHFGLGQGFVIELIARCEKISRQGGTGLWPPAPLPARRAYRPEGRAYASERCWI